MFVKLGNFGTLVWLFTDNVTCSCMTTNAQDTHDIQSVEVDVGLEMVEISCHYGDRRSTAVGLLNGGFVLGQRHSTNVQRSA